MPSQFRRARVLGFASLLLSLPLLLAACEPSPPLEVTLDAPPLRELPPLPTVDPPIRPAHRAVSDADRRVIEMLQKNVPEVRFQQIQFENAINFMRDLQRVNINPNWGAMEQLGITKNTEFSLKLRDVSFETALMEMLSTVAGREGVLDYMIRNGVIKISTREDLWVVPFTRVYDVRDLLQVPVRAGQGRAVDELLRVVRTSVAPDSWEPVGWATIREQDGSLVVTQSATGHRDLAKLLDWMRVHTRIVIELHVYARLLTAGQADRLFPKVDPSIDLVVGEGATDDAALDARFDDAGLAGWRHDVVPAEGVLRNAQQCELRVRRRGGDNLLRLVLKATMSVDRGYAIATLDQVSDDGSGINPVISIGRHGIQEMRQTIMVPDGGWLPVLARRPHVADAEQVLLLIRPRISNLPEPVPR